MYLFTFLSKTKPKSAAVQEFEDVGGAYVNCWINFKDYEASEKLARLLIRDSGWVPIKKTAESVVKRKYLEKETDKQYYAEAVKYGYSLVFNVWPKDAEDAEVDYDD